MNHVKILLCGLIFLMAGTSVVSAAENNLKRPPGYIDPALGPARVTASPEKIPVVQNQRRGYLSSSGLARTIREVLLTRT